MSIDTQAWRDSIWKNYKHTDNNQKLSVTLEEAYIVKKQMSLNLQFLSCAKIQQRFEPLIMVSTRGDIS